MSGLAFTRRKEGVEGNGWKTSDMLGGIEGVMNLAAASGEDLATISDNKRYSMVGRITAASHE